LLAFVSVSIGVVVGLFCAYFFKRNRHLTHSPVQEIALIFFFGFMAYLISDIFEMSGIISLLVCGIIQTHYCFYNLSPQSKMSTSMAFQFIGFAAEALTFGYLGLTFFTYVSSKNEWS